MTGDQQDMLARLRGVLPTYWFPDSAPLLDAVLNGLASTWSWICSILQYVRAQTRIATATDVWLDVIALDFFGDGLARWPNQEDSVFRGRIQRNLFRERGTRAGVIAALQDLTGQAPIVFEPARATDTGGYGSLIYPATGLAYGAAGGWGSMALPFQCFITAYRPLNTGIAFVSGWGGDGGGYGEGALEYAGLDMVQGQVTDDIIYAAVAEVLPVSSIGWTNIVG
jgi:hypothetical protein